MNKRVRFIVVTVALLLAVGAIIYRTNRVKIRAFVALKVAAWSKPKVKPNRKITWKRGPAKEKQGRPNIVFILLDDVGYNDLSVYGGGLIKTPNIDKLAAEGALFTQAYAGNATCAPSRAMLLTGRYPSRNRFHFTPTPGQMASIVNDLNKVSGSGLPAGKFDRALSKKQPPYGKQGLSGEEVTIAELLKKRGYHTVHIGKWHLGRSPTMRATAQGFDESLLMASGLYMRENDPQVVNAKLSFDPIDKFLWAASSYAVSLNNDVDDWFEPKGYLTDYFTNEATRVIEANANRPFFLYLAHWGVHTPLQATRADYDALAHIKPHRARVHAAMIRSIDRSVGKIMKKLADKGLAENTIVVLSSDNGGAGYIGIPKTNAPFRGFKLTFFEGGIRVPTVIRWPQRIAPKTRIATPITHVDLMPTLAAAAETKLPPGRKIDGQNLLPLLLKNGGTFKRPDDALFWSSGTYKVVRAGGWKLQVDGHQKKKWLFHLTKDPTEKVNLATKFPDKVKELQTLLEAHWKGAPPPHYPSTAVLPTAVDQTLAEPFKKGNELVYWPN